MTRDPQVRAEAEGIDFTLQLADAAPRRPRWCSCRRPRCRHRLSRRNEPVDLPPFFIDRFEVRNREFKEFVDAGGYARAELWRDLPFGDGRAGWQDAVAKFIDTTGRPGPATWEAGTYRDGMADNPVDGVSWFEAVAYARFRGKELPTAYHWYRAAYVAERTARNRWRPR